MKEEILERNHVSGAEIPSATACVCYLCGSSEHTVRRNRIRYGVKRNIIECRSCGFIYLWPRTSQEETVGFYKKDFRGLPRAQLGLAEHNPDDIFTSRLSQAKRRFEMVKPYLRADASVLEIGCAAGSFVSFIKPIVQKCSAIELDPIFADYVREKFTLEVIEKPVEELSGAGPFDAIFMWHVLEHLHDPVETVKRIMPLLSDSGYLFVEVPNILDPLLTVYHLGVFDDFYYQLPHLYYFSPITLQAAFEKAGCRADIIPLQLYGLGNHIRWLLFKEPQSHQPKVISKMNIFDHLYRFTLRKIQRADTLFAIVSKP